MDFLQKIGGRKFLMALVVLGIGVYLEMSGKGLSPTMAGFMIGIVGTFHMANYASTKNYLENKGAGAGKSSTDAKLDSLIDTIQQVNNPETVQQLTGLLTNIDQGVMDLKNVYGQLGALMVNLGNNLAKRGPSNERPNF